MMPVRETTAAPRDAIGRGLEVLARTQGRTGSWKGDYGGPLFLLPLYVFTLHAIGRAPNTKVREGITAYFRCHQNADGGFGLDVEGASLVFTSVLVYAALRLLGVPKSDPDLSRARLWFLRHGGAAASASWGKHMLAVMGLYAYEGLHPTPPELWLLPTSLPFHPSRMWCHSRMVYLPMSWLYAKRAAVPAEGVLLELREELYEVPFAQVDWVQARDRVARTDVYTPRAKVLRYVNGVLHRLEKRPSERLRQRACDFVLEQIDAEDRNTNYLCIGPVSKLFNTLVWHFAKPGGEELRRHVERLGDYLFEADDGIKMNGYDSSELWDTAFALQAIVATGRTAEHAQTLAEAYRYLDRNQVREDVPNRDRYFRHASKGGWPFSTKDHGWPISDCTAEGLKAALLLEPLGFHSIDASRLRDAAVLLLSWQNHDGGWATYEKTRGPAWLEKLNPSDVFSGIMIDHSYVECTSAGVQALVAYRDAQVGALGRRFERQLSRSVELGRDFLLAKQQRDGSWEGSWGVCFTYGTWFAIAGLRAAGLPADHPALQSGVRFLESKQRDDGSWSESVESCRQRRYIEAETGQAVQTSWALLSLVAAGRRESDAVRRGVEFLKQRQLPDGRWPEERLAGVFNKTCAIHYDVYLRVFPVWALAACSTSG